MSIAISGVEGKFDRFVLSCDVERSLDKATMISLSVANPIIDIAGKPRSSDLLFTDSLALMPGNVIEVFMGYGQDLSFVGAGVISTWMPNFPQNDKPTIELRCFDALKWMMDGNDDVESMKARKFEQDTSLVDIALQIFNDYGFGVSNVDTTTSLATLSVPAQKKLGMSDYQFVRGIANTIGWDFYVEWDVVGKKWDVFFRPPFVDDSAEQTFTWGPDFEFSQIGGLLLEFFPEFTTNSQSTDIEVFYFDRGSKTWERIRYPEEQSNEKKEFEWKGDDTTIEEDLQAVGDANSGRGIRIQADGVSVEVVPATGFKSSEEAQKFAERWWKARQSELIAGQGKVVGYAPLAPGQRHELQGLGKGLSGKWYFSETSHHFRSEGERFTCGFHARKVIP